MSIPNEITDLIQSSGNNFHAKVARWFSEHGWHVEISPYYMDQTQGKAREIDLIVEKVVDSITNYGSQTKTDIVVRLYVECKYIAQNSVFWFVNKNMPAALNLVCKSGLFPSNNSYTNEHHHLTNKPVAKVFSSSTSNKNAEHEPFYKALNQALNSMVSMQGRQVSIPRFLNSRQPSLPEILEFPIVICNSFERLFSVEFFSDADPQLITENFQLEVQYAYVDRANIARNDYFLLDFVSFEKLEEFVNSVEKNANSLATLQSN
jgi:hypothetical protein